MSVLTISLPDDVREWAEQAAATSGTTLDEFFSALAREAKARAQSERDAKEAELERLLLEALDAGEGERVTSQWWNEFRGELDVALDKQRKNGQAPA